MLAIDGRRAAEVHHRRGESFAAFALTCKLYRVIGWRVETPAGEIDLEALAPTGPLCFVAVKTGHVERAAAEAVSAQRNRIARAAEFYLGANQHCATKPSDLTLC